MDDLRDATETEVQEAINKSPFCDTNKIDPVVRQLIEVTPASAGGVDRLQAQLFATPSLGVRPEEREIAAMFASEALAAIAMAGLAGLTSEQETETITMLLEARLALALERRRAAETVLQ